MNIANLVGILASIAWFGLIVVVGLAVTRAARNIPAKGLTVAAIALLVLALVSSTVGAGLVFIQPEERGVVISAFAPLGYREEVLTPGLSFVIPYAESVTIYKISKQTYTMSISSAEGQVAGDDSISARTSDGQEIAIDASIIFNVDPTKVIEVHIVWQDRYEQDLVRPKSRGIIRDAVAQFRVDEVISTERANMAKQIEDVLRLTLSDNGLILDSFVLRNITFSQEYGVSVEQKQIAEQQALQAKFVVESKKQEAEQARQTAQGVADAAVISATGQAEARVIEATAEATALRLIADVLRGNPTLLQYQYITNLAPTVQTIFIPSGNQFILPLPSTNP